MAPRIVRRPAGRIVGKYGVPLADRRAALRRLRELKAAGKRQLTEKDIEILSRGLSIDQIAQMNRWAFDDFARRFDNIQGNVQKRGMRHDIEE